jgi:predicted DNA-binding transcriptional regulator AlpA
MAQMIPVLLEGKWIHATTDIVSVQDIADRWGYAKSTVSGSWQHDPTFPAPVITLGNRHGWLWKDVKAWLDQKGIKKRELSRAKKAGKKGRGSRSGSDQLSRPDGPGAIGGDAGYGPAIDSPQADELRRRPVYPA